MYCKITIYCVVIANLQTIAILNMKDEKRTIDSSIEKLITPDGQIVIGKNGKIVSFNEAAERLLEAEDEELAGNDFSSVIPGSEIESIINDALFHGISYSNLNTEIVTGRGETKGVLASVSPVFKGKKDIVGVLYIFRDTSEILKLAEELTTKTTELMDERNKLDSIFNSNIEGTFTIDNDWNITSFNLSAEKITGYKKDEVIGKKCRDVFRSSKCGNGCHMEQTMKDGTAMMDNELVITTSSGSRVPIRVNSAVLRNNRGQNVGAVENFIDISEIKNLTEHVSEKYRFGNIIGRSKKMEQIFDLCKSVAPTESTILITGESGTGKELLARAIHLNSDRKNGPFVAVNCSAFAETLIESELFGHEKGAFTGAVKEKAGRFEMAKGGTLFLDETGDISLSVQTKLLRVLETKVFERVGGNDSIKMNARIITATNKNLEEEIIKGNFRADLFYRINVINIHLPPLRERPDDMLYLVNHFIEKYNSRFSKSIEGMSTVVWKYFQSYSWPGNIRELENVLERCFILSRGKTIEEEHLPERIREKRESVRVVSNGSPLVNAEKETILNTLEKYNGSRKLTAGELRMDVSTLWRKMKKYGLL